MSDNDSKLDLEKVTLEKFAAMESDLKIRCIELDESLKNLEEERQKHEAEVKKFDKKNKIISDSDAFNKMVGLVDEIYTMYVAHYGDASGLYDSIKLLLDSRARYSNQSVKR